MFLQNGLPCLKICHKTDTQDLAWEPTVCSIFIWKHFSVGELLKLVNNGTRRTVFSQSRVTRKRLTRLSLKAPGASSPVRDAEGGNVAVMLECAGAGGYKLINTFMDTPDTPHAEHDVTANP